MWIHEPLAWLVCFITAKIKQDYQYYTEYCGTTVTITSSTQKVCASQWGTVDLNQEMAKDGAVEETQIIIWLDLKWTGKWDNTASLWPCLKHNATQQVSMSAHAAVYILCCMLCIYLAVFWGFFWHVSGYMCGSWIVFSPWLNKPDHLEGVTPSPKSSSLEDEHMSTSAHDWKTETERAPSGFISD